MKNFITIMVFVLILVALCLTPIPLLGQQRVGGRLIKTGHWEGREIKYADQEINVKIKAAVRAEQLDVVLAQIDGKIIEDFNVIRWGIIEIPEGRDVLRAISVLQKNPMIENVEPSFLGYAHQVNDPKFSQGLQWALRNTGQSPPGGTNDADIDGSEALGLTRGSNSITLAILDSGIPMLNGSLSHPDLDDPNRFILGADFVGDGEGVRDRLGHGTHVTGIAAAETDNDTGIAGVAGKIKVLIIQVFDVNSSTTSSWVRNGIIHAVDNGAKVINYSGSTDWNSQGVIDAISYARTQNVLVVASAGNQNSSLDTPARLSTTYDNVIAVGSTQYNDMRASYSNYGIGLNVVAPGGANDNGNPVDAGDIYSTTPNYAFPYEGAPYYSTRSYGYLAGTSMAAPHVSGLAASMLSLAPALLPHQVREIIQNTADKVGPLPYQNGWNEEYGYGRINAHKALKKVIVTYGVASTGSITLQPGESFLFKQGERLHIEGKLTANGTASQPIHLGLEAGATS